MSQTSEAKKEKINIGKCKQQQLLHRKQNQHNTKKIKRQTLGEISVAHETEKIQEELSEMKKTKTIKPIEKWAKVMAVHRIRNTMFLNTCKHS